MYVSNRQMLLVLVERKSRFVKLAKCPKPTFVSAAKLTPKLLRVAGIEPLTITNDRGAEFKGDSKISTPIYFCDPHSPQQRGTIENTIGLLRQYLPLTADIDQLTDQDLRKIEHILNSRPRKCLNYHTPHEVIHRMPVALATLMQPPGIFELLPLLSWVIANRWRLQSRRLATSRQTANTCRHVSCIIATTRWFSPRVDLG